MRNSILIAVIFLAKTIATLNVADNFNDDQNKTPLQHHEALMQGKTSLNVSGIVIHLSFLAIHARIHVHAMP